MTRPRVELLYFEGCPHHEAARASVEQVANELDVEVELELVRVHDPEEAARFRFLGSPTVRIDGRDVEPGADGRSDYVLSCRVYRLADGISGQPDPEWVRAALSEARRQDVRRGP